MTIEEKIIKLVTEQFDAKPGAITRDTFFVEDLSGDSLDAIEIVMQVEETFDLMIEDAHAEGFHTVGDVIEYVQKQFGVEG